MSIYDRQERIQGINKDTKVLIVGCGGIGFHVAKLLAMSGVKDLHLFDPDVFEDSNFNRIDVPIDALGINKADVTLRILEQMRPEGNFRSYPFRFKGDHVSASDIDWLVDCTDVHTAQTFNRDFAKRNGLKYLKVGYNGTSISINDEIGEWDAGETPDGYTITPSWAVPAVIIAALAVGKILKYHDKEIGCDIADIYERC
jgi:molybdopterin/thiamine biosynthesis adenylyltransferase